MVSEEAMKFGATFCLIKSPFKTSMKQQEGFEYTEHVRLFHQCADTKESQKAKNNTIQRRKTEVP